MPVCPVRLDAQASGLSVGSIQLATTEFDVPDRFVSIIRVISPGTRWVNACVAAIYLLVRTTTLRPRRGESITLIISDVIYSDHDKQGFSLTESEGRKGTPALWVEMQFERSLPNRELKSNPMGLRLCTGSHRDLSAR